MGIFSEFFSTIKKKIDSKEQEKFVNMSAAKRAEICKSVLNIKDDKKLKDFISKSPYVLPYIIGDLGLDEHKYLTLTELVDIATQKGVDVMDLVDKSKCISNSVIVNTAVKNQPELVLELNDADMKKYQDLITSESLIEAFVKNPLVILSDCKALKSKIRVNGTNRDGSKSVRYVELGKQLQRAMNLYTRPEAYMSNGFDDFAKSIAERISNSSFMDVLASNKMTTRSITAANETLKSNPNKGRVMPAKSLHNWNNRVLYTLPNYLRKHMTTSKYDITRDYLLGLLKNPALNSFSVEEKTRLVKKCCAIVPELYFDVKDLKEYSSVANQLTVQLTAYETLKKQKKTSEAEKLLGQLGEEKQKKLLAKVKSNKTRKTNKKAKKVEEEAEVK